MKVIEKTPVLVVHPSEMKDGQIGVIVEWAGSCYLGEVVQRYGDELIVLNKPEGQAWGTLNVANNCKVRILPNGTTLEITDN